VLLPRLAALAIVVGFVAAAGVARADDARDVSARVAEQWRAAGAAPAVVLPSRFVFEEETVLVGLPVVDGGPPCVHIAVVGARGLSFRATVASALTAPAPIIAPAICT